MAKYGSILETVGNTPVVRINKLAPDHVNLYVKIEAFNPLGSVKDRLALGVIEDAERKGLLKPGQTVITSGLGGVFPAGIPVGTVVDSRTVGYGLMTEARVKLGVDTARLNEVMVLVP